MSSKKQNISFFVPKKDQCDTCVAYAAGNIPEDEYNDHNSLKTPLDSKKQQTKMMGMLHIVFGAWMCKQFWSVLNFTP